MCAGVVNTFFLRQARTFEQIAPRRSVGTSAVGATSVASVVAILQMQNWDAELNFPDAWILTRNKESYTDM